MKVIKKILTYGLIFSTVIFIVGPAVKIKAMVSGEIRANFPQEGSTVTAGNQAPALDLTIFSPDGPGDSLISVTITVRDNGGSSFNPNNDLATLSDDQNSGLIFWRETNGSPGLQNYGENQDPQVIPSTVPSWSYLGSATWESTISFSPIALQGSVPTGYTHYLTLRAASGATGGHSFKINIESAGDIETTPNSNTLTLDAATIGAFTILGAPRISSITPRYGTVGSTITIAGTNFGASQGTEGKVYFNGMSGRIEATISSWSDTQIQITIPSGNFSKPSSIWVERDNQLGGGNSYIEGSYDNTFAVLAQGEGTVYGVVKTPNDSATVSGARVRIRDATYTIGYETTSASNGSFILGGITAGSYFLDLTPPEGSEFANATTTATITAGQALNKGTVNLAAVQVYGVVKTPVGVTPQATIEGSRIEAHNKTWTSRAEGRSGSDGVFRLAGLTAGNTYYLEVSAPETNPDNYQSASQTEFVAPTSSALNLGTIRLTTINVTGLIKTPTGDTMTNPSPDTLVPQANVTLHNELWTFERHTQTGSEGATLGAFTFGGVPEGNYVLEIEPPWGNAQFSTYARTSSNIHINAPSEITNLGIKRFSLPNIIGRVLPPTGDTGVQNAMVNINYKGPGPGIWANTQTDSDGNFRLYVSQNGTYSLEVNPPMGSSYARTSQEVTITDYTHVTPLEDIRLGNPNVTGTVLDPDGHPLPNANINISNNNGLWFGDNSGQDGTFRLGPITVAGQYNLEVRPPWEIPSSEMAPYQATLNLTTELNALGDIQLSGPDITGTIKTPAGDVSTANPTPNTAVQNAGVQIRGMGKTNFWRWSQTDSSGNFGFSGVPAGTYAIDIQPPYGSAYKQSTLENVNISEGGVNLNLTIGTDGAIRLSLPNVVGTVKTPTGEVSAANPTPDTAVAWAQIDMRPVMEGPGMGGGNFRWSQTGEDGSFGINIPAGTYTIEVRAPSNTVYSGVTLSSVQVPESGTLDLNQLADANISEGAIRLSVPNVMGTVTVAANDETPVNEVWVMVHNTNWTYSQGANSNSQGKFALYVPEGTYQVELNNPWNRSDLVSPEPYSLVVDENGGAIQGTTHNRIYFTEPTKTISGYVRQNNEESGDPVQGAMIFANRDGGAGFAQTQTDEEGAFSLNVAGGNWWVMVQPNMSTGTQSTWSYTGSPKRVNFSLPADQTETQAVNFAVATCSATITGLVKNSSGTAQANVWVEIRSQMGQGNGGPTDNNGRFTVKVPPGSYFIMAFTNSGNYGSPDPVNAEAKTDQTTDVGTLTLKDKNATITGIVVDDSNNAIAGAFVNAFGAINPGWANATTDNTGAFSLSVSSGTWFVTAFSPSENYANFDPPQRITINENETITDIKFTMSLLDATISGKIIDGEGHILNNVFGGIWIKPYDDNSTLNFGFKEGGDQGKGGGDSTGSKGGSGPGGPGGINSGTYTMKVPAGHYLIGVGLPPGSNYTFDTPIGVTIASGETLEDQNITLKTNNATITGYLTNAQSEKINSDDYPNLFGQVFADNGSGGWQMADFRTNDQGDYQYSMSIAAGTWSLGAFTDSNAGLVAQPLSENDRKVTVGADQTVNKDFIVQELNAYISGTVTDPDLAPMANVWVFPIDQSEGGFGTKGPGMSLGGLTDNNGNYNFRLPTGTYQVSAGLPPWITSNLVNPNFTTVTVSAENTSENPYDLDLQFKAADSTIAGTVTVNSNPTQAFVWAYSETGGSAQTEADTTGSYSLNVTKNETWHVGAVSETSGYYYESPEYLVATADNEVNTLDINLSTTKELPQSEVLVFDASSTQNITLSDGTTLNIPSGSLTSSGTITLNATPKAQLSTTSQVKPIGIGYDLSATDEDGRSITSFISNITIAFKYTHEQLDVLGISEDDIVPTYWDSTTNTWKGFNLVVVDKDNNIVTITTNHFTQFALVKGSDTQAPDAPTLNQPTSPTTNTSVTISGTAEASSTVKIYDGATLIATVTADASSGAFSSTVTLTVGTHTLTATATDTSSNTSSPSASKTVVITTASNPTPETPSTPDPDTQHNNWAAPKQNIFVAENTILQITADTQSVAKGQKIKMSGKITNLKSYPGTYRIALLVEDPSQMDPKVPNTPKTLYSSKFVAVRLKANQSRNIVMSLGTAKLSMSPGTSRTVRAKLLVLYQNKPYSEVWQDITITN